MEGGGVEGIFKEVIRNDGPQKWEVGVEGMEGWVNKLGVPGGRIVGVEVQERMN